MLTRIKINGSEPVVVDYWATWCGPCKLISPVFNKLEAKYPNIKFAKVDVEEQPVSHLSILSRLPILHLFQGTNRYHQEVAQDQKIRAMPTFIAYKDGAVIETFTGAVPAKLEVSYSARF
jgi:thioredoxin 1